jgi:hypothetical protein
MNDYVVNMWEMSLRNNNKKLYQHLKGAKLNQTQLEQMLHTAEGWKKVERSIPLLPLERLKGIKERELSLKGRNWSPCSTRKSMSVIDKVDNTCRSGVE